MDIRISGYGDNAVLELPPYSVGQTKSHVAVRQISTYTLIDYNGNYGTEVVLISGQRVLAGCWPEDLSKAMTVATRIYETVDIPIPDEVVDLKLLLKSQQECDRLRAEVEAKDKRIAELESVILRELTAEAQRLGLYELRGEVE